MSGRKTALVQAADAFNSSIPLPKPLDLSNKENYRENLQTFKFAWSNYAIASGLDCLGETDQMTRFTIALGQDGQQMILNINLKDSDRASPDALLAAIENKLCGPTNMRYDRMQFNQTKQKPGESYDDYFARLRVLVKRCQFGKAEDELLLDHILVSILDRGLRKRMTESKSLTLLRAMDWCKSSEKYRNIRNGNQPENNQNVPIEKPRTIDPKLVLALANKEPPAGVRSPSIETSPCGESNVLKMITKPAAGRQPLIENPRTNLPSKNEKSHNNAKISATALTKKQSPAMQTQEASAPTMNDLYEFAQRNPPPPPYNPHPHHVQTGPSPMYPRQPNGYDSSLVVPPIYEHGHSYVPIYPDVNLLRNDHFGRPVDSPLQKNQIECQLCGGRGHAALACPTPTKNKKCVVM